MQIPIISQYLRVTGALVNRQSYRGKTSFIRFPQFEFVNLSRRVGDCQETPSGIFFYGFSDVYQESLCLLWFKATALVPKECDCMDSHSWSSYGSVYGLNHETHGTHHAPVSSLTAQQNETIRSLTHLDRQLFFWAVQSFISDIEAAEQSVGFTILCQEQRAELLNLAQV